MASRSRQHLPGNLGVPRSRNVSSGRQPCAAAISTIVWPSRSACFGRATLVTSMSVQSPFIQAVPESHPTAHTARRAALVEILAEIQFRIGINLGDIIKDGRDIYGDGVNVAARLEALAEPGGICVNRVVC
jgi:hypothetical protein